MTDDERIKQIKECVNDMQFQSSEEMQDFIEEDVPWLLEQIEIYKHDAEAYRELLKHPEAAMIGGMIADAISKQNMQKEDKQ